MRQTLFRIPLDRDWSLGPLGDVPGFGFGIVLLAWSLFGLWAWWRIRPAKPWELEHRPNFISWCVAAAVIVLLPVIASKLSFLPADKSIPIRGYGAMMFAGFVTGGWFASRRVQQIGLPTEIVWDLAMWIFVGGVGGARIFYLIQYGERVFRNAAGPGDYLARAVAIWDGGLVFYGGMVLATIAYILFCHIRKINPLVLGDAIVPSVFIGMAFGRMGCFLNGCCFGDRCTLPWAVEFPFESVPHTALVMRGFLDPDAPTSLPLHPTQIYSSLNALVLALLTGLYFRYRDRDGAVVALALIVYPITRSTIELLRGDEMGQFGTSLTIAQIVSILIFAAGVTLLVWTRKSTRNGPTRTAVLPGTM